LLLRGFSRLPQELAREGATDRIALLLRTAWVYGMLGNLALSVVLLQTASGLQVGEPLARHVAMGIAVYYVAAGLATHAVAPGRHAGLLAFGAMGAALLAALWISR